MAKKPDSATPSAEQEALVKGKTPRNAIMSIGILAAVVIGGLGFYYQLQATNKADEDARIKKATRAEVEHGSAHCREQQRHRPDDPSAARRSGVGGCRACRIRSSGSEARRQADADRRRLPGRSQRLRHGHARAFPASGARRDLYVLYFKQAGASRSANQATGALPAGVPSLDEVRAARNAAGANTPDAMALALAKQGQAPEDRDRAFLRDAASQGGIERTTFNGRSTGCTLTPPHVIHVKTVEGLNSDKPGRVSLMVDEDVYDSLRGDCLMIPKGAFINGMYSADIKVGQERLLVASTSLRLPNGKSVPLNGMQGADQNGYAGFSGDVNNHFLKIFGAGFITAILLRAFDSSSQTATTATPERRDYLWRHGRAGRGRDRPDRPAAQPEYPADDHR